MSELISIEPATGKEFWRHPIGNVDAEVARARAAWPEWAAQLVADRIALVRRYADEIAAAGDHLATTIARETGKPLWETKTEVQAVINKVDISISAYEERTPHRKLGDAAGAAMSLRHKPHGVMAVLGPYNFPAHLPNGHIVPALIAGNTIVFKSSEKTPATAEILVQCLHKAGVPEDAVRLLIGAADEGKALVAHEDVDGILFTGSATTGIAINKALADQPDKIVALEMGGNNPMIVMPTGKVEDAATLIIQSAFTTSGQRCSAAGRLIVHKDIYDAVIAATLKLADRLIVDEPFADPAPYMGPVIDNGAADGLVKGFDDLVSKGGKIIKSLERRDDNLPFLTPAIVDVTDITDRPDEELFGPLLQVIKVDSLEEAIAEANNTRFGLSASLVGGTAEDFEQFWTHVRAGIVNWNRPTNGASSAAPFGGVGLSGNHRPSAYYAADYCAYPVASAKAAEPEANISVGLSET